MEYRSDAEFLGIPLVHVKVGTCRSGESPTRGVARGWVAVGDVAFGVLFAAGGLSVGCISLGGLSVGVLSLGGLALGGLALGGGAVGYWALGGAAFGLQAALGGLAVASEYAVGGLARAAHANDEAAKQFFTQQPLLRMSQAVMDHSRWFLLLLLLPVWMGLRNRRRGGEGIAGGPGSTGGG